MEDVAKDKATRRADRQRGRNPIRIHSQQRDQIDTNKLVRVLLASARQGGNDDNPDGAKRDETP